MMKHTFLTLIVTCALSIQLNAQTPFDSFAPEATRPMLEFEEPTNTTSDSILCAIVADVQNQMLLLVDISTATIVAATPITDDIRKWLSVDPLADKYPSVSPYAYCAWNPIKYVDPDGRDIYTFDSDGNFTGNVIKQDGDHIGRIYLSKDKYMDFSFNDQSYADRICELYSDKYFSLAGQNNPDLSPITHVSIISNDQINSTLPLKDFKYLGVVDFIGGASGGLVGALAYACGGIGSLSYAFWESRGGKLDFINNGLIQSTANALFLPTDGKNLSYDSFDFGNYLWGQSMRRMGIGYGLSVFGAHADCLIHTGKLDSKADQRAIRNGYMFNTRR